MTVTRVSVRIQSDTSTHEEITQLLECSPTSADNLGEPVSPRSPSGPRRSATTWIHEFDGQFSDFGMCVDMATAVLASSRAQRRDGRLSCDLVLMVVARPLGWMLEATAEQLRSLTDLDCGLTVDVYDSEDG